jgi:hypothetical protein
MQSGYSGTPLPKKLGIKAGTRVRLLNAPPGFELVLGDLPMQASFVDDQFDVAIAFCTEVDHIESSLIALRPDLDVCGGIWLAWPKKASGVITDCNDGLVRASGLSTGMVDNKVCAIDETWSALRFVIRVKDR